MYSQDEINVVKLLTIKQEWDICNIENTLKKIQKDLLLNVLISIPSEILNKSKT